MPETDATSTDLSTSWLAPPRSRSRRPMLAEPLDRQPITRR